MEFEWDEIKCETNIKKHGLDFIDAVELFEGAYLEAPARTADGEQRWLAVGIIGGVHVTVIFTWRGEVIRIISMRRARHGERKKHQEVFGG